MLDLLSKCNKKSDIVVALFLLLIHIVRILCSRSRRFGDITND